jgi:bifunctional non-homologous end joining protein LigD
MSSTIKKAVTSKSEKKTLKKVVNNGVEEKKVLRNVKSKKISSKINITKLVARAPKSKMPVKLSPMLATLVDKPFDKDGWMYEVKWDGYRTLAFVNNGKVELKSRNDKSFSKKFYPITQVLSKYKINAVLDGEVVVVKEDGVSNFGALQNWRSEVDGELLFYVFDIVWYEGNDLMELPLIQRKAILKSMLPTNSIVKPSDYFLGSGIKFFKSAKSLGLEGIIAKKTDSIYYAGDRSKAWLKIKANKRQEMVIGGYTINDDTSKAFSSLLVGVYNGKDFIYTGKVGTGFNTEMQRNMLKLFKPLVTKKAPFNVLPDINKPSRFRPDPPHASVTWLKPQLVCEVEFSEMTSDGVMRHPSFQGMRIDKKAKDVVKELEKPTSTIIKNNNASKIITAHPKGVRKTLLNPTDETQVRKINGKELTFTHLNKLYWPKEKISKRDLLNYYYQAAPYILPYLIDRPQSMLRHPDGIKGFSFFYKNIKGKAPDWVDTYDYHSEGDGEDKEYLVAKDEASLLYMASLGCIEMNPWSSRVNHEDKPDWCIIDIDPSKKNTFNQVIETALVTKDILEGMGIKGYAKTSGSTGIHVYIPMGAKYTYEQSKEFARLVATLITKQLPKFTTIERIVKNREGKMYIDFLQNRPQATVSAPYSVRPKPGATVSMPLHWEEVKKGLKMSDFTIHNSIERMRSEGDIFKPVLGKGINLEKVIKSFEKNKSSHE